MVVKMLIGFTGLAGCGKSTAAKHLAHEHNFTRFKMSDPLKNMLRTLFAEMGLDPDRIERMIEGDLKEVPVDILHRNTPRHAMQTLGTDWGRDMIHPNFWVTVASRKLAGAKGHVVVEDVRFDNEAKMIRLLGGRVVKIERHGHPGLSEAHESEAGVSRNVIDKVLHINGGVDQLQRAVSKAVLPIRS